MTHFQNKRGTLRKRDTVTQVAIFKSSNNYNTFFQAELGSPTLIANCGRTGFPTSMSYTIIFYHEHKHKGLRGQKQHPYTDFHDMHRIEG